MSEVKTLPQLLANANLAAIARACNRPRSWAWRLRWGETVRIDPDDRKRLASALNVPSSTIDAAIMAARAEKRA